MPTGPVAVGANRKAGHLPGNQIDHERVERARRWGSSVPLLAGDALRGPQKLADLRKRQRLVAEMPYGAALLYRRFDRHAAGVTGRRQEYGLCP